MIYIANGSSDGFEQGAHPRNALYQRWYGLFADVTNAAAVGDTSWSMGCAVMTMTTMATQTSSSNYGRNTLYRNEGAEHFVDVTDAAGTGDDRWGTGAVFGDYDRDGDNMNLFVANYVDFSLDYESPIHACGKMSASTAAYEDCCRPADVLYRNRR